MGLFWFIYISGFAKQRQLTFTTFVSLLNLKLADLNPFKKKAPKTPIDNEFYRQLYSQLGFQVDLSPYEIREYVRQGYLINPHIYTVVNKIIRPASAVPCYVYEIKDRKSFIKYERALKTNNFEEADFYKMKSTEIANYPEIEAILENPNDYQSFQEWSEQGMAFHLITGEEFIYGTKNAATKMMGQLYNMPPQVVKLVTGDYRQPVKGYEIDFFGISGDSMIPVEDVLHIKMMNPNYDTDYSHLRGLSPLSPLCRTVKRSNDTQVAQMRLLQNGHPVGILSNGAERGFDDKAAQDLKRKWKQQYGGAYNVNEVLLTALNLNWTAMGLSTTDLQLLESDKLDLATIARAYEVPLPLVLNDASTYNNIKEARKEIWMTARLPLIKRRVSALNRWLIPKEKRKNTYIDFDISSIEDLRLDDKELVERICKEIQNGLMTINEGREMRGREPFDLPQANTPYMGNFKPIEENGNKTGDTV